MQNTKEACELVEAHGLTFQYSDSGTKKKKYHNAKPDKHESSLTNTPPRATRSFSSQ